MRKTVSKTGYMLIVFLTALSPLFASQKAFAQPLTAKSVTIASSLPSAVTNHNYQFTIDTINSVGSIAFEYCENSPIPTTACVAPSGLSVSASLLQAQAGETGFTKSGAASTVNKIVLTRPPTPTSAVPVSYQFSNVTNQTQPNSTAYVRIATYASINGTGPAIDEGAVAYSTASAIAVNGYVPPYITFCVGVTVAVNCSSASGAYLNFGELSTSQPRFLSSQFSVATNDPGGYATYVTGSTMTSGNNTIPALEVPTVSQRGTNQFGMNLRANSNPSVGSDPAGVGSGAIASGYNIPNQFFFKNQVVAASPISTEFNAFTASYVVNVNADQRPGVYVTTLTYIAIAAF